MALKYDEVIKGKARHMVQQGASSYRVGKLLGVDHKTVERWCRVAEKKVVKDKIRISIHRNTEGRNYVRPCNNFEIYWKK